MASRRNADRSQNARVGIQVGDFVLREQIGNGSFAAVHRAKNIRKGGYAAVKCVIMSKLAESKKLRDNLTGEIKIMRSVKHPHIVSLMDCRESDDQPKPEYIFLVMEYCSIGDLSHFIKKREHLANMPVTLDAFKKYPNPRPGGLNEVFVRHFVKQLASALEFLHSKNLIHRDLKPQNVLVAPSWQARESANIFLPDRLRGLQPVGVPSLPILKIADFGFARMLPPQGLAETLCGSPLYMAPEILAYQKYDGKADLWSFGALVYEMVTGRPPFRAGNHMELLKVIDNAKDQIRFPAEVAVSPGIKDVIRKLLKRQAVERCAFDDFFQHPIIVEEIPNLVDSDREQMEALSQPEVLQAAAMERTKSAEREEATKPMAIQPVAKDQFVDAVYHHHLASSPATPDRLAVRPRPEQMATAPPGQIPQLSPKARERPLVNRNSTDMPPPPSPASVARRSMDGHRRQSLSHRQSMGTPQLQQAPVRRDEQQQQRQEKAAQDIAFERDYVLIEKKAVEMNALADEFQASPRMQSHRLSSASQRPPRPSIAGFHPASAPTASPHISSRAAVAAQPNQPDHLRRASFEQRARQSSATSATSALAKAIGMATGRLIPFGNFGASPPVPSRGSSASSVPTYGPFPAYQAHTSYMLIDDGKQSTNPDDEDTRTLHAMEETATKSDVVYGFAQVKYMQIIPQQPSAEHGLGLRMKEGSDADGPGDQSADLTPDAMVTICEEAFVLYVKTMELLQRCMDIAGVWWAKKNRGQTSGGAGIQPSTSPRDVRPINPQAHQRVNSVFQWVRARFNETFEKAHFIELKLKEAQSRLPPDHPSHPNNKVGLARLALSPEQPTSDATGTAANASEAQSQEVLITAGVTADRIMYQRALEMMRAAAVNELVGEDLPGCEISYVTAIRMLEVVVEGDATNKNETAKADKTGPASAKKDKEDTLDPEDRDSVLSVLQTANGRLQSLRNKMNKMQRRTSSTGLPPKSPRPRPASLSPAHASAR